MNSPFEIDRDRNAVVNMLRIGQGVLLGKGRPAYLTRGNNDLESEKIHE